MITQIHHHQHLICLTGLTGCGKTTTKNIFASYKGVKTFYTKDLHEAILGKACLGVNKMDVSKLMPEENGFIKKIMSYIEENKGNANVIVLDSIRSTAELEYIKRLEYKSISLIRVACSGFKRLERLKKRDNCDEATIFQRDLRDTGLDNTKMFNMKELFKYADSIIDTSNDFADIEQQVFSILSKLGIHPQKHNLLSFRTTPNNNQSF